jgi:hypothetical protein
MFKYLRTLNTEFHPSVVEFCTSPKDDGYSDYVDVGMIVTLKDGAINNFYSANAPLYLALTRKDEDANATVKCIRLSSGMVLEADVDESANINKIVPGALLAPCENTDFKINTVTDEGTAKFEVLHNYDIKNKKATIVVL